MRLTGEPMSVRCRSYYGQSISNNPLFKWDQPPIPVVSLYQNIGQVNDTIKQTAAFRTPDHTRSIGCKHSHCDPIAQRHSDVLKSFLSIYSPMPVICVMMQRETFFDILICPVHNNN